MGEPTTPPWSFLGVVGFSHAWFFLCLLLVVGIVAFPVIVRRRRRRRTLRFANMWVLESVAPERKRSRWRHLPVLLSVVALTLLTTAMAGPTLGSCSSVLQSAALAAFGALIGMATS